MFRVATGVRPSEIGLVRALFSNAEPGYRVLNPNLLLCSERAAVSALLAISDVLVLNKNEYHELARLFGIALVSDVHRLGPQTVVLTLDEQGGICSHKGSEMRYSAVRYAQAEEKIYPPGAGDWFLGGFVSSLSTGTLSLSVTQIHHALRFAAQVSGKKVTMPGAGNGPTLASL
jgi:sugar/nucleoside kinase (ribokinase family)